ncbi:MAG: TIGR02646 family protein [Nannocystaceae bacterium]
MREAVIHIDKGPEPRGLVEHRASPDSTYADFRSSKQLRAALLREQGSLCAYCMQRIRDVPGGMKVEHWYPQSLPAAPRAGVIAPVAARGPLDYGNLLGVCAGGEGQPRAQQHCDTHKGNRLITIDPLDHPERLLSYRIDGSIHATMDEMQSELDDVLNLNVDKLRHNRKSAWDGVYAVLKQGGASAFRPRALRKQLDRLLARDSGGRRREYCGFVAFFLDKKLRRSEATRSGG